MVYSIGIVVLGGCVYAVGDRSIEKYDSYNNSWNVIMDVETLILGDCNIAVIQNSVVALEGHLYFIGNTPSLNQCQRRHRYYFPPWLHSVFQH